MKIIKYPEIKDSLDSSLGADIVKLEINELCTTSHRFLLHNDDPNNDIPFRHLQGAVFLIKFKSLFNTYRWLLLLITIQIVIYLILYSVYIMLCACQISNKLHQQSV